MLDKLSRFLVTGGAGFIGSHLCEELVKLGKKVIVIDDLSTGREENLPPLVDFLQMEISGADGLDNIMKGVDIVFHVAAQPSTRTSIEDPDRDFRSNVMGTFMVLNAARWAGVKRFIYTSSSAVYGEPVKLPLSETDLPAPVTPYGASKISGEHYCRAFNSVYNIPCICLRPFNVYGPRENLETSLDEVVRYTLAAMEGRPITVYGDGRQTRDFVCVSDVVRAHILAVDYDGSSGNTFNIGTGKETSINALIETIESITGKKANILHKPWPEGDIKREYGNIYLAKKILGYKPEIELSQGISQILQISET